MRFQTMLSIVTVFHCSAATWGFLIPWNISKLPALHIQWLGEEGWEGRRSLKWKRMGHHCLCCNLPMARLEGGQKECTQQILAEEECQPQLILVSGLDASPFTAGLYPGPHTSLAPGCHVILSHSFPGKSLHCDFSPMLLQIGINKRSCVICIFKPSKEKSGVGYPPAKSGTCFVESV